MGIDFVRDKVNKYFNKTICMKRVKRLCIKNTSDEIIVKLKNNCTYI